MIKDTDLSTVIVQPIAISTSRRPVPKVLNGLRSLLAAFAHDIRKNKALLLMALPGVLLLLIFNYLPMFGIVIAFQDYRPNKGLFGSEWVWFDNFRYLFGTGDAVRLTFRTLGYNAVFIAANQIMALTLAVLLNEVRSKWLTRVYQTIYFIPFFISWVVAGYLSFALLNTDEGAVNRLLINMGAEPVRWYGSPQYWPPILVLANIWKNIGFYTILYLAGIIAINPEYYEAARIDGANKWQEIRRITLPLLVPLVTITTLLAIGRIMYADFGLFYHVTRDSGQLYVATDVLDTYVYRALRTQGLISMPAAAGLYQSVIGFTMVMIANWWVKRVDPERALF
jgi:putative aldouronate transport system permease protein